MITVLNREYETYGQDIRELLEAFFPGQEQTGEEAPEASFYVNVDRLMESSRERLTGVRFRDKSVIKEVLYDVLSRETGKQLPWGTLTGIKPVKLAVKLLKETGSAEGAAEELSRRYRVSTEKAQLAAELAQREELLMQSIPADRTFSLYAGIPFCPTRCLYCSFTSNPIGKWQGRVEEYLECLEKELRSFPSDGKKLRPASVYVGGGTPTALDAGQLERLLSLMEKYIDLSGTEYTVESGRPDSITRPKLDVMKRHGVQRISINPQTMNDRTLEVIGRRHTAGDVIRVFGEARDAGFDNINMDLIMGLPGETPEDVQYTLEMVRALSPDSLTIHTLAVKRAARLSTDHDPWKEYPRADGEEAAAMVRCGYETARSMGMVPYYLYRQKNMAGNQDNTGYALPGKECLYNVIMMEERQPVTGIGAGSTTKIGEDRFENIKDIGVYLERIDAMIEKRNTFLPLQGCFT